MERIRITKDNIKNWPKFEALLNDGKIKFDSIGRLRYLHGAPVGDLIQIRTDKKYNQFFKKMPKNGLTRKVEKLKILFGLNKVMTKNLDNKNAQTLTIQATLNDDSKTN